MKYINAFLQTNSVALVEIFNAIFACGIFLLYTSYVLHPSDTEWTPTFWDYTYFTWEKILFLIVFLCQIPFVKIRRIQAQSWILAGFSLIRLIWQITEISNQTFGTGIIPQWVLSIAAFFAVIILTIPPFIKALCTRYRFLRKYL